MTRPSKRIGAAWWPRIGSAACYQPNTSEARWVWGDSVCMPSWCSADDVLTNAPCDPWRQVKTVMKSAYRSVYLAFSALAVKGHGQDAFSLTVCCCTAYRVLR